MARSWAKGNKAVQDYNESPLREAAKSVRLWSGRYLNDRASTKELLKELRAAIKTLEEHQPNNKF